MSNIPKPMTQNERAERRQQIIDAVRSGGHASDVAKQFNVSLSTVLQNCRGAGLTLFRGRYIPPQYVRPGNYEPAPAA